MIIIVASSIRKGVPIKALFSFSRNYRVLMYGNGKCDMIHGKLKRVLFLSFSILCSSNDMTLGKHKN